MRKVYCQNRTFVCEMQFLTKMSVLFRYSEIFLPFCFVGLVIEFARYNNQYKITKLAFLKSYSTDIITAILHKKWQGVKMTPSGILGI